MSGLTVKCALPDGVVNRPGAGACPVRGHSNVQGDRTVGIYEKPPRAFTDSLSRVFGFEAPTEPGYDVVDAIRAMRDGKVRLFMGMGGNFVRATPDSVVTEEALAAGHGGRVLDALCACLGDHFDVEHCTFQIEPVGHTDHEHASHR